ncbi:MAG: hypothetical protein ACR2OV_00110 [Hyphomicrobiaceae bacterium]
MISRCHNLNNSSYERYGARGIYVCDRWRTDFRNYLEDMGERPEDKTLDRIDPYGPYSPENCRWATIKEQRANITTEGDRRMREGISKGVKAYWREWRKTNTTKLKHIPAGPKHRVCQRCGTTFIQDPPIGQPRKYCTLDCRNAEYAERARKRYSPSYLRGAAAALEG